MRAAALLAALVPLAAAAQTYKWRDASGQVHYSQVPPASGRFEAVGPAAPKEGEPSAEEAATQKRERDARLANDRRNLRTEACRQARERTAFLDSRPAGGLTMPDPRGGEMPMSADEYQRQRAEATDRTRKNCDGT